MLSSRLSRLIILLIIILAGVWLLLAAPTGPGAESVSRQNVLQGPIFAPVVTDRQSAGSELAAAAPELVEPVLVDLADIEPGVYDPDNQYDRWQNGEIDLDEQDGIISELERAALQEEAMKLPPSENIQQATSAASAQGSQAGAAFDSIDYTECCGGGGNVPPDPELAVGPNHIIAVVNVAFEIYDKSGATLVAPTTFSSFLSSNSNCTGLFDPNALYDEEADRYILGIDADGTHYCLAVSNTNDPTGTWSIYAFQTAASGNEFFDYPHAGVGNDAIYMGANMFHCTIVCNFIDSRIWAFDKWAMYNQQSAAVVSRTLGQSEDTPQPLHLHGWNQGTWPGSGPHYILTETNYNGASYTVYSWNAPFNQNNLTNIGTMNLVNATGVPAGMPLNFPQAGSSALLQGNDYRPQDFEYRNGYAWTSTVVACNPGSGTVNCVRWAQIDPTTAAVVDAGVYASNGEYRTFADLAVNHCDDMGIGYTKSSTSIYPSIYYTGRESSDPAGTLQAETLLKSGVVPYTAFDGSPHRWGDYTEMTIDPDGLTFWYLGEYSKNTGTSSGRWGTYIGSFSFPTCSSDPDPIPDPGDVSCDGTRNVVDALHIMQYEVGLRTAINDCPPADDEIYLPVCDVNGDSSCNVVDALFIMQCEVGIANSLCPTVQSTASQVEGGAEETAENRDTSDSIRLSTIRLGSGSVEVGETAVLPIWVTIPDSRRLTAVTIDISYDPALIAFDGCTANDTDFNLSLCAVQESQSGDEGDNQIRTVSITALAVTGKNGELLLSEVSFTGLAAGQANLTLTVRAFEDGSGHSPHIYNGRLLVSQKDR